MISGDSILGDLELAALDFETTGLHARGGDRVIEVAVVRGRPGSAPRTWSTLVAPGRPVGAVHVHGISEAMLRGAPTFAATWPQLHDALAGAVIVAHNAPFDMGFLEAECERLGVPTPARPVLDTLGLARRLLALPSHSLGALCAHFEIERENAHRAADDAHATWTLACAMLASVSPGWELTLDDAQGLCRKRTSGESLAVWKALDAARARGAAIAIEYRASGSASPTRRDITVQELSKHLVVAYCHLRGAERVFRLDRIRLLEVEA